jgi:hypothetical protein
MEIRKPTNKTFTTERQRKTTINISRKGSIVKERCRQLTEIITNLFPNRTLSDDDLVCLIQDYIGADKETIRSYKGYSGHIRTGRCGDNKIVGLSRKGYLEQFGFLRKIPGRRWVICQLSLASQDMIIENSKPKIASKEKSSISQGERIREQRFEKVVLSYSRERKEEEDTEKDRNFSPKIYGDELKVFDAVTCAEPDGAKTNLRRASKNG